MSQPIGVTLPHRLGKAEALRRLQASFSDVQSSGGSFFVVKNQWSGDHLDFRASVLGQSTTGTVDVADDHVRLEVQLPWLLSLLANKAKALVHKQGKLMLEKPVKPYAKLTHPSGSIRGEPFRSRGHFVQMIWRGIWIPVQTF